MSAGNDKMNRDDWSADDQDLRDLFETTAAQPGAETLERLTARAAQVARETPVAGRSQWQQWAVGALIAAAAVLALVLLAGLPGAGSNVGKSGRTAGVAPADVIQDYRALVDAANISVAADESAEPFAEQFEDPFVWDEEPGLLDGLALLAGPGSGDDPEAWDQFYDEMLEEWDDLTDDEQAAFE